MDFTVEKEYDGRLLRDFLRFGLLMSHTLVSSCKRREDGILLDGRSVTVRAAVHTGQTVTLALEDTEQDTDPYLIPVEMPLSVLYEDEYILALDKPPYMPTHPSHLHRTDTLANALAAEYQKRGIPFVFRAVNRLDADTSGVLLIAKNRYAAERFSPVQTLYEKRYLAICEGRMEVQSGEIESYIRRVGESIIRRASFPSGQPSELAKTRYRVLSRTDAYSLVECMPVTGRTHQLRVHLSAAGHPIVGDDLYGGGKALPRQALHAAFLTFVHPFSGEKLCIRAPLPADLAEFAKEKGLLYETV